MELARDLTLLVAAVIAVAALARRLGRTAPLLLVVAGFVASYLPGVEEVRIEPDIVLVGFLPPLLYATAHPDLAGRLPRQRAADRAAVGGARRVHRCSVPALVA